MSRRFGLKRLSAGSMKILDHPASSSPPFYDTSW
jgi:hypothetical protein